MFSPQDWRASDPARWHASLSQLLYKMENEGCVFETADANEPGSRMRDRFDLYVPGLDSWVLFSQEWMRAAQRCLWDRAELHVVRDEGEPRLRIRWVYWTPPQILLHAFIALAFLSQGWITRSSGFGSETGLLGAGFLLANLLPILFVASSANQTAELFKSSGFTQLRSSEHLSSRLQ
jgi:hypothetical protein